MKPLFFLIPVLFLMAGCRQPDAGEVRDWQVTEVSSAELGVKTGMHLKLGGDSLRFTDGSDSISFGYLGGGDRVILESTEGKRLFSVIMSGDSLLIWRELYTGHPLVITMIK